MTRITFDDHCRLQDQTAHHFPQEPDSVRCPECGSRVEPDSVTIYNEQPMCLACAESAREEDDAATYSVVMNGLVAAIMGCTGI